MTHSEVPACLRDKQIVEIDHLCSECCLSLLFIAVVPLFFGLLVIDLSP